jgi:hypothetical protein
MLTDNDLEFVYAGEPGMALVWVIGEDCLYDLALSHEHANIFLNCTRVVDISSSNPVDGMMTLELYSENELLETLHTTEYFGSILLSNPKVLDLSKYPLGKQVESPYAKFINEEFVILPQ